MNVKFPQRNQVCPSCSLEGGCWFHELSCQPPFQSMGKGGGGEREVKSWKSVKGSWVGEGGEAHAVPGALNVWPGFGRRTRDFLLEEAAAALAASSGRWRRRTSSGSGGGGRETGKERTCLKQGLLQAKEID